MKLLLTCLLAVVLMAQTKFHMRYFSTDPASGITIYIQTVEEAGCVKMDNCGWVLRWDAGQKIGAKWDQADFEVGYMDNGSLKTDARTALGSALKSRPNTLWPVFVQHPTSVVYIRVTILNKSKVMGRAEFK